MGCGPANCSKKKFPFSAGCWSYISENNCRHRYAKHLIVHTAHRFTRIDAFNLAFDQGKTLVDQGFSTFQDREDQRKIDAHNSWKKKEWEDRSSEVVLEEEDDSWKERKRSRPWNSNNWGGKKTKWQKQQEAADEIELTFFNQVVPVNKWRKNRLKDAIDKSKWAEKTLHKSIKDMVKIMAVIPTVCSHMKSAVEALEEEDRSRG